MNLYRDGHTVTPVIGNGEITIRIACPHDGKTDAELNQLGWLNAPCLWQGESGEPGAPPYYPVDECLIAAAADEYGVEAFRLPKNAPYVVTTLPVRVQWWWERDGPHGEPTLWLAPVTGADP